MNQLLYIGGARPPAGTPYFDLVEAGYVGVFVGAGALAAGWVSCLYFGDVSPGFSDFWAHLKMGISTPALYIEQFPRWSRSSQLWVGAGWTVAPATALAAGIFAGRAAGTVKEGFGIIHRSGPQLLDYAPGLFDIRTVLKSEGKGKIRLHPKWFKLTLERMSKGIFICGSTGSGKSVALGNLRDGVPAGVRVLLNDVKGDFIAEEPGAILISPTDKRSWIWAIGEDLRTFSDALLWSGIVIPQGGHDPMWSQSARMILIALIVELQNTMGRKWGFGDLGDLLSSFAEGGGREKLAALIKRNVPHAQAIANGLGSKTGDGIEINLSASVGPIVDLAKAWPRGQKGQKWSLRRWLADPQGGTVVLGGSSMYPELSKAVAGGIVGLLAVITADPSYANDDKSQTYLLLDECPQLGPIPGVIQMLEVGRSKGICSVIVCQDFSQFDKIYSVEERRVILSSCSTHLYFRLNPSPTCDDVSSSLGDREIERLSTSTRPGKIGSEHTQQYQSSSVRVVKPHHLSALKVSRRGCESIIYGIGDNYHRVRWPFKNFEKQQPAHIAADWTKAPGTGAGTVGVMATPDVMELIGEAEFVEEVTQAVPVVVDEPEKLAAADEEAPASPGDAVADAVLSTAVSTAVSVVIGGDAIEATLEVVDVLSGQDELSHDPNPAALELPQPRRRKRLRRRAQTEREI